MKNYLVLITLFITFIIQSCSRNKNTVDSDMILNKLKILPDSEKVRLKFNSLLFEHYNVLNNKIIDTVIIENIGNKPFKIWKVHHSCDCTNIEISDSTILPNMKLKIPILINVSSEKGFFSKRLVIYGNMHSLTRVINIEGTKL